LRAILDLAYASQETDAVSLADICKRQNIPEKFLAQIMLTLKKAGFVDSRRGVGGGYFLKRKPESLTIGDIIRHIDGPLNPTAGVNAGNRSAPIVNEEQQALEEVWIKVTHAVTDIVDRVTFADLMCRAKEIRETNADFNYII